MTPGAAPVGRGAVTERRLMWSRGAEGPQAGRAEFCVPETLRRHGGHCQVLSGCPVGFLNFAIALLP